MSCILRISGDHLDIEALLREVLLKSDRIWLKGQRRFPDNPNSKISDTSGASFVASDADLCDFDRQVTDATKFLKANLGSIRKMKVFPGVESLTLDFGIELRDAATHSDFLPPDFLKIAADSQVTVELSHYPCSQHEESEQNSPPNDSPSGC
jgi:hypothetical protein